MTATEYTLLATALLLLAGNAAALAMWRRTRVQRDDALDAADTMLDTCDRAVQTIGEQLRHVTAERDAATERAARAESRERIAHAAWGRAVDKLLAPAPLTISAPRMDSDSLEELRCSPRHLQVVSHG